MNLKIYALRDAKAGYYLAPSYARQDGEAIRDLAIAKNNPTTKIHMYLEDYDLYYLGEYDDQTGKMDLLDSPQHLKKAIEIEPPKEAN